MRLVKLSLLGTMIVITGACASSIRVSTNPGGADVYVMGKQGKRLMGKSPIEVSSNQLEEVGSLDSADSGLITFVVKLQGFEDQTIAVPTSRLGTTSTTLLVKMEPGGYDQTQSVALIQHLFNAQRFAQKGEYERAQVEVDRALDIDPNFPRGLSMRASIYFLQKNYTDSLKWYEQAVKLDPSLDDAVKMISHIRKITNSGGST